MRLLKSWVSYSCAIVMLSLAASAQEDERAEMIAEWRRDAQIHLTQASDPAAADILPEGVRPNELALRRRDLEQTLLAIGRYEKTLAASPDHERALENAELALSTWTGFDTEPPYSILELDDLQNQHEALLEKKASLQSSLDIMTRAMDNLLTDELSSAENLRRRNTEADRGAPDAAWRVESARITNRQIQVRKSALTANITNLRIQLKTVDAELALLDRKITIIARNAVFSDEDFASITQVSEQRKKSLHDELAVLRDRQRKAGLERDKATEAHEKALAADPEATTPLPALNHATARLFTAETTVDSLQIITESLEWLLQIEAYHLSAQEDRRNLLTTEDRAERASSVAAIRTIIDRLKAWEIVANNEIAAVAAALTSVEARVAALGEEDIRMPALNERRAILLERQAAVHRVGRSVSFHSNQLSRWIAAHETRQRSATDHIADQFHTVANRFDQLMAFEVFTYQKGEGEEGQRSVTLRDLLYAFLVFLIPYFILDRVIRRIQRTRVTTQFIGEAQANTLRNWLMMVIAFLLAIIALNFLDIPLTVFAFLGGALAIGLGFGMQTLIKNFISGIIVLFERRIRVGDIIDVDGSIGTVTEINTRSSVIRNADGVETMVPNSLFLENRVTNLTLTNRCNRRVIRVGVAYGTQPGKVLEVLRECVDRHGLVLKTPEPLALFEDFGDNALIFGIYFWVEFNERTNALQVASDLRIMIEKRFAELEIGIPFPQRDLHLVGDKPVTVRFERKPSNITDP